MDDEDAEEVVASIVHHYAVGNAGLTSAQFGLHLEYGGCPACAEDANFAILAGGRELTAVQ